MSLLRGLKWSTKSNRDQLVGSQICSAQPKRTKNYQKSQKITLNSKFCGFLLIFLYFWELSGHQSLCPHAIPQSSPVRPQCSPARPQSSPARPQSSPARPQSSPVRPQCSPGKPWTLRIYCFP